ncbi:CD49 antigen-like family member C [Intoshia linei]|uniref:CD49 antigen-like family member C n=1 Tax=Intoshia linei TaxID=1819745 RepID=A0A177BCK0_9BILA|nr:CD49 antigen-like family member C [Intoshia linei]
MNIFLWRICAIFLIKFIDAVFNLEPNSVSLVNTIEKHILFGYSAEFHKLENESYYRLIIGAPKARIINQTSKIGLGDIYSCIWKINRCKQLNVLSSLADTEYVNLEKNLNYFFGYQIKSHSSTQQGDLIICAPRYEQNNLNLNPRMTGLCVSLNNVLDDIVDIFEPCNSKPLTGDYLDFGQCQAGWSLDISRNGDMLIGAPSSEAWRGAAFYSEYNNETENYDAYVTSPGKINSDIPHPTDFMGYSLSFANSKQLTGTIFVSAPGAYSYRSGSVHVYFKNSKNGTVFTPINTIDGENRLSFFGHSIKSADFNGDGFPDLAVADPYYFNENSGGAVFIYLYNPETNSINDKPKFKISPLRKTNCYLFNCVLPKFGYSIQSADFDLDGYDDLIVGAPYANEQNGLVYVYRGSNDGLDVLNVKKLFTSQFTNSSFSKSTFGQFLSTPIDIDGNGYPDIAISAPGVENVYIFRSRPVLTLNIEWKSKQEILKLDVKPYEITFCAILNLSHAAKIDINYLAKFVGKMKFKISVDLKSQLKRFLFKNGNYVLEGNIEFFNTTKICQSFSISQNNKIQDVYSELEFELSLIPSEISYPNQLAENFIGINDYPVIDPRTLLHTFKMHYKRNCENDNVCNADIILDYNVQNVLYEEEKYNYIFGTHDHLIFDITVTNNQQEAHGNQLVVIIPEGVQFSAINVDESSWLISHCHTLKSNKATCSLPNLNRKEQIVKFNIKVNIFSYIKKKRIEFIFYTNTSSVDINPQNNYVVVPIYLRHIAEIDIQSDSIPKRLYYDESYDKIPDNYDTEKINTMTVPILHVIKIINKGPSTAKNLNVLIRYPYSLYTDENKNRFIYFTKNPTINKPNYCKFDINRDEMFNEFVAVDLCLKNSPIIPPWKDLCDNIDTNGFKKLIQFYYSLNCSNTYIERVFSVTNIYWTEHKSNLSLKTLKSVILLGENSKEKCTNVYTKFVKRH